jgi:endonuclease-3
VRECRSVAPSAERVPVAPFPVILDRLRAAYGVRPHRVLAPLDELILTVLSQNTSDINCERAYAAMRGRYPRWQDVLEAEPAQLVAVLRQGGLANQKAPRIQAILAELAASPAGLDLGWLAGREPEAAMAFLTALPGVGAKTASCVLLFSLGMPVMPVDTHVHRIAVRLGLIGRRVGVEAAHPLLTAITPRDRMLEAHLLLIEHGRRTCRARRPRCDSCVLLDLCPFGATVISGGAPRPAGRSAEQADAR